MSLTELTVVEVGTESSYGVSAGNEAYVPFLTPGNAVEVDVEDDPYDTDSRFLTLLGSVANPVAWRLPSLSVRVGAATASATPPLWTRMFLGCGFRIIEQSSTRTAWAGPYDEAGAVGLRTFLDSRRVIAPGSRGGFTAVSFPARTVLLTFSMTGLYQASAEVSNPTVTPAREFPPRWCGPVSGWPAFSFWEQNVGSLTVPVCKRVAWSIQPQVELRFPSHANGRASKVELAPGPLTVSADIEVEASADYVEKMRLGTKYAVVQAIKHGLGGWLFGSTGFTAKLGEEPVTLADEAGWRLYRLTWRCERAADGSAVLLQHFGRNG